MADQIVGYARRQRGSRVGNGQCFTLVDPTLRNAHAQSAADYGTVTPDADYTWGTSVSLSDLRPGDVIQFRDYVYERTVVTDDPGAPRRPKSWRRPTPSHRHRRKRRADGAVTVLEQNAPDGSPVTRSSVLQGFNDDERQAYDDDQSERQLLVLPP